MSTASDVTPDIKYVKVDVLGPLKFELMVDGERARLIKDYCAFDRYNQRITVPAGYITDFASVPRIFWNIVPPWGKYSPAAVVHDWLYSTAIVSRSRADQTFFDIMTVLGVSWWKRNLMWAAVRSGGWMFFPSKSNKP